MESLLTARPPARLPRARPSPPSRASRARTGARTPWGVLTAALLLAAWLIVAPRSPDLAGQVYRADLFERAGFVLWDNAWYAGHHVPGYSLTWPWLASWLGVRASGVLAVLASAYIFERLARTLYGPRTTAGTIWFAVAAAGDAWIGRLTFALGVTLALAAALAAVRTVRAWPPAEARALAARRRDARREGALAAALGGACAATSPVAGLLLALAYCSYAFAAAITEPEIAGAERPGRALARSFGARLRPLLPAVLAPLAVVLVLAAIFPEGGFEPYAASSIGAALAVTLAFVVALPREERLLRVAAAVYALVNLLALVPTPLGSNIQRYGILLAAPLLLCALGSRGGLKASRLPRWALVPVLAGMALWVIWGPLVQSLEVSGDPSTQASYYTPVERFLGEQTAGPLRIEVPFTRAHWEAAYLAPHVALARGWERQLDKRYDLVLESHTLSAAAYRRWLDRQAVSYVALPDVGFDQSSTREVQLIRDGLPYLREVFRSAHWRIYRVLAATPLASALPEGDASRAGARAARLSALGTDSFTLTVATPGRFLVRVHYSPYWTVTSGTASVRQAPGGFTEVRASRPGAIAVAARFSLAGAWRALGMAFGLT